MKAGDVVRPHSKLRASLDIPNYGIVSDAYEDDYGTVYYEVYWGNTYEVGWWNEHELELVSENE